MRQSSSCVVGTADATSLGWPFTLKPDLLGGFGVVISNTLRIRWQGMRERIQSLISHLSSEGFPVDMFLPLKSLRF